MGSAVFPLAPGPATSLEATTAKLGEKVLGIGTECVGEMDDAIRSEVTLEEVAERTVGLRVVDELGAENDVEFAIECAADEVELDAMRVFEPISPSARAHELERGGFAIDEPDLRAERGGDKTGQAEPAAKIEHALSRKAAGFGQVPGQRSGSDPKMRPVGRLRNEIFPQQRFAVDHVLEPCDLIERDPHVSVLEFDQGRGIPGDLADARLLIRFGHLGVLAPRVVNGGRHELSGSGSDRHWGLIRDRTQQMGRLDFLPRHMGLVQIVTVLLTPRRAVR